jgi:hypothetical protein
MVDSPVTLPLEIKDGGTGAARKSIALVPGGGRPLSKIDPLMVA